MATTELRPMACPSCGHVMDRHTSIGDEKAVPKEGDFTICIKCAAALRYGKDYEMRIITDDDYKELKEDPDLATKLMNVKLSVKFMNLLFPQKNPNKN